MAFRFFTFATIGVLTAYVAWPFADNTPPISIIKSEAINSPIQPGNELKVKTTVRRWRSCPSEVDRIVFDSENTRFVLPDEEWKGSPGPMGEEEFVRIIPIDVRAARGRGRYVVTSSYKCNWAQRLMGPLVVSSPVVYFEIAGPPLPIQIPGAR